MQTNVGDPAILLNWTMPFDEIKLNMLEQTVHVMLEGNPNDVSRNS